MLFASMIQSCEENNTTFWNKCQPKKMFPVKNVCFRNPKKFLRGLRKLFRGCRKTSRDYGRSIAVFFRYIFPVCPFFLSTAPEFFQGCKVSVEFVSITFPYAVDLMGPRSEVAIRVLPHGPGFPGRRNLCAWTVLRQPKPAVC